jgi:methylated-DNA-protein-cysteine methyltransferase-like protein
VTTEPTENQCDWTATPRSPDTGSRATIEYVPLRTDSEHTRTVLARVRSIPEGFVRAYGDITPGAPRVAGAVLHDVDEPGLPWWRVVRADGSLAKGLRQRQHLEREGVPFRGERVDMRIARIP